MKPRSAPNTHQSSSREIHLKQEFLEMIKSGQKTLEVRIAFPSFQGISAGDEVTFQSSSDEVTVRITGVRQYRRLSEVLESENVGRIAPGVAPNQVRDLAARIFNEREIREHGLLVFEFKKE